MAEEFNDGPPRLLIDQYDNMFTLKDEISRGGQGVVYRTTDTDIAIKQPLVSGTDIPDTSLNLQKRFEHIRLLPLPERIEITLPISILKSEPGYVMQLLNNMKPFEKLFSGRTDAEKYENYSKAGSARFRLGILAKCAAILARLHNAGLVYGDISDKNCFMGEGENPMVWLIDADNLAFETVKGKGGFFTPGYGAPEIVTGRDSSRPRTDCWAFAVLAFKMLTLIHPFLDGKMVQENEDEDNWDSGPNSDESELSLDQKALMGFFPYVYDEDDDSNAAVGGLPPELIFTSQLQRLFQETFGPGRTQPWRRPSMAFWAWELTKAYDQMLVCPKCGMSYFEENNKICPFCDGSKPAYFRAVTPYGVKLYQAQEDQEEHVLPHRLFYPFSLAQNDKPEYYALLDFNTGTSQAVRGTVFPDNLKIEFVEERK